jgi:hypothetical protein
LIIWKFPPSKGAADLRWTALLNLSEWEGFIHLQRLHWVLMLKKMLCYDQLIWVPKVPSLYFLYIPLSVSPRNVRKDDWVIGVQGEEVVAVCKAVEIW